MISPSEEDGRNDEQQQVQEEAHYHWTINEFVELINKHGALKVIHSLPADVEEQIYWMYYKQFNKE